MNDPCPNCGREVALEDRFCRFCSADLAPPNVRFAARPGEAKALAEREATAIAAAHGKGASGALDRMRELVAKSELVINRKLRSLALWVEGDDELYVNFYQLKARGVRMVNDRFNRQRISAENTISPTFFDQLVVGALTVDGSGMPYYGDWSVVVRDRDIRIRASVFWENPFIFNKRMQVISGDDPPEGYRAPWSDRDRLAVAKLGDRLDPKDDDAALARHLMGPDRSKEDCDFIEVHVHGAIHVDAIERVVAPKRMSRTDRTEWGHLRRKLVDKGVLCREMSR